MRKGRIIGIVLGLVLLATSVWALAPTAGTVTSFSDKQIGRSGVRLFQVSYTTDAAAGTFTATIDKDVTGWILKVQTDPGATAPTALYDVTLEDSNGEDVMGGSLANRSATVTESAKPLLNGNYQAIENYGQLTIKVTNAGNSKTAELLIYYLPF